MKRVTNYQDEDHCEVMEQGEERVNEMKIVTHIIRQALQSSMSFSHKGNFRNIEGYEISLFFG